MVRMPPPESMIEPADDAIRILCRDGLRAEHVAGNREAQRQLVDQLLALAYEVDGALEPETEQLLAELHRPATRTPRPNGIVPVRMWPRALSAVARG
jgi:hypothetical protein